MPAKKAPSKGKGGFKRSTSIAKKKTVVIAPDDLGESADRPGSQTGQEAEESVPEYDGPRPDEELLVAVRGEVRAGDAASVERIYELLRSDEDIDQRSPLGLTPLAVAAAAGNGPLVSLLLERRADVTLLTTHRAELALHYAARNGNRVVCQLLAEPSQAAGLIDKPNTTGWPALHLAAMGGHLSAVTVLTRCRADINSRNAMSGGGTALHFAVRLGAADAAEALLDRDAQVDALDVTGRGALHFAAARADSACVSLLLRSRADPTRGGHGDKTPLECVPLEHPNREKVVTLLAAYARPMPEHWRTDRRFDKWDPRDLDVL
mmetsp:Transcript_108353/g.271590  ORF Transcript_108353/g.271590 Transcript_108353/m.271590 type:complete len:321 (-) Transcript_108353:89-1051(-)